MTAVSAGLHAHLGRGGGLLGVHASGTSFRTLPDWPVILGGQWVPGTTMHPEQGDATIKVRRDTHPVVTGLADFGVFDERYSWLATRPDITVLVAHDHAGVQHPIGWARDAAAGRVIYDGLGHDARSYDSEGHLALLRRSVRWLLGEWGLSSR